MLRDNVAPIDLIEARKILLSQADAVLEPILKKYPDVIRPLNEESLFFEYPVLQYLEKINTHSFDKTPEISGVLKGIKAQYLILDTGVLNVRKFGGYEVSCSIA